MVGKGSVGHNNRLFLAENVDAKRVQDNVVFKKDNIKKVYCQLFDGAVDRYNNKQTRKDRRIDNYYEKIRTSKQEKLFHEIIIQIGNRDDTNCGSVMGDIAKSILIKYMEEFEERNPYLKVFNAVIHMDEETPHLHIDYVPFTTGSKRGLDTRVSHKQALAKQGFVGISVKDTEWHRWVNSEKCELEKIMNIYKVEWMQKGTQEEHLSVYDYKKQERIKEVDILDNEVKKVSNKLDELNDNIEVKALEVLTYENSITEMKELQDVTASKLEAGERELERFVAMINERDSNLWNYENSGEYKLQDPSPLMSVKSYKEKIVEPLVYRLKSAIKKLCNAYTAVVTRLNRVEKELKEERELSANLLERVQVNYDKNQKLQEKADKYDKLEQCLSPEKIEALIKDLDYQIMMQKQMTRLNHEYNRWKKR